jgi:hypothetical protein
MNTTIEERMAEARDLALSLELAIRGAIHIGVVDDGVLGRSLQALASHLSERLLELAPEA